MVTTEIQAALEALQAELGLLGAAGFARRAEALDELEVHVLHRLDDLPPTDPAAAALRRRAEAWQIRLEAANQRLFRRLQAEIRAGHLAPAQLRQRLLRYAGPPDDQPATHYDHLDALTNGLFPEPVKPLEPASRDPEMVYYQKTPARVILELATKLTPADVLYDLGSGLGQVPLLAHLLSGAPTCGIEIEPDYCHHAQHCVEALQLPQVQFQCADVRHADLADGTAFYLFTPFTGSIMREVLLRLRELAQQQPLRLFSYGPSTEALREHPWLRPVGEAGHLYQLAEFRSR